MLSIVEVGDESLELSPNGDLFAFVYPDVDDEANILSRRASGHIRIGDVRKEGTGAEMRKPGSAEVRSSFPSWSPDGRQLAYFVEDSSENYLEVWDSGNGQRKRVGSSFSGDPYLAPQWDSTGNYIVFARAESQPDVKGDFLPPPTYARVARGHDAEDLPRVVVLDSKDKRIPGDSVFIEQERAVLTAVNLENSQEARLTDGPVYLRTFAVSPGGQSVIFSAPTAESFGVVGEEVLETFLVPLDGGKAPRSLSRDGESFSWNADGDQLLYLDSGELFSMDLDGSRREVFASSKLPHSESSIQSFDLSSDGRWAAVLATDDSYTDPEIEQPRDEMYTIARPLMRPYLVSLPEGELREVAPDSEDTITASGPVWASDSNSLFFKGTNVETFAEHIYQYDLRSEGVERLTNGNESVGQLHSNGNTLLFAAERADFPADLYALDVKDGSRRRIAALNPHLSEFEFSVPELFHFVNGDGETMGALLYRPVGVDPSTKVPVITYVYEKLTPLRHRFNARHQIFLNHGFAVLMPNVKIRVGEPGTSYVKNVIPATAAVRSMGFTNGKFSIWGGSFGAYATSYIITQTDMFACAVARATPPELFNNWASGRDRDSQNIERGQARIGGSPYEVMERYLAQSAFFHLDKVETPVLIMHGAQDKTILFDEGEMFFYALRQLGKEAKFVAYTHGDHSLYRHSRSDAVDVHQRLLDWFDGCLM